MSYNGYWTFTEADDQEWAYEAFESKEECIEEGNKLFSGNLLIGQLQEYHVDTYKVVNEEKVNEWVKGF